MTNKFDINQFFSYTFIIISLIIIPCLWGCNNDDTVISDSEEKKESQEVVATVYEPLNLSLEQEKTAKAMENFAGKYLLSVMDTDLQDNVMVSPLGLNIILTMLSNGMDESAIDELKEVLGVDDEALNSFYTLLQQKFATADNQVDLYFANSVWVNNNVKINDSFSSLLKDTFNAESYYRFLATDETRKEINQWCSEKTNDLISNFLKQSLDSNTILFLANAIYFNGKWSQPFDKTKTFDGFFNAASGAKHKVAMMNSVINAFYSKLDDGGEIISLPYGNGSFLFNIYLPSKGENLKDGLRKNINAMNKGTKYNCDITLPKFAFSYDNEKIIDALKKLGINSIMESGHLNKICTDLMVNFIQQSTTLEITEEGAAAAAVTGLGMIGTSIQNPNDPIKIIVDRPFAFSIAESKNNITLISGFIQSIE